jgi:hypothetical protein
MSGTNTTAMYECGALLHWSRADNSGAGFLTSEGELLRKLSVPICSFNERYLRNNFGLKFQHGRILSVVRGRTETRWGDKP